MYGSRIDMVRADAAWLARNWWAIALRGVAGIVFSVLAAVRGHSGAPRWFLLLEGVVGIAAGVVAFVWPGLTAIVLLYVIAAWAIITGVLEIAAAARLHNRIRGEWWLVLGGILSVVAGVWMMRAPGSGALAVVLLIGAYVLLFGILQVVLAFRLRGGLVEAEQTLSRAA